MMFDVAAIGEGAFSVWEAEGRVTLDGAELELCQDCKAPVHHYGPDGAPYCGTHGVEVREL